MKPCVFYFRHLELYNLDLSVSAYIDAFMADKLSNGCKIFTYIVNGDKLSNNSNLVHITVEPCEAILIGTIPYYLLIANLYYLEDQGFTVYIHPRFIKTDHPDYEYPQKFIRK